MQFGPDWVSLLDAGQPRDPPGALSRSAPDRARRHGRRLPGDGQRARPAGCREAAFRRYARQEIRKRFTREALAAARLSSDPSIVTIYDVGESNGRPFIVMQYVAGGSLEDVLKRDGAQPPDRALGWLEQADGALDYAHAHGVVHRDVKPANILLDDDGGVHVADFGVASAAGLDSLTQTGRSSVPPATWHPSRPGVGPAASRPLCTRGRCVRAADRYAAFEADSPTAEAAAHIRARCRRSEPGARRSARSGRGLPACAREGPAHGSRRAPSSSPRSATRSRPRPARPDATARRSSRAIVRARVPDGCRSRRRARPPARRRRSSQARSSRATRGSPPTPHGDRDQRGTTVRET